VSSPFESVQAEHAEEGMQREQKSKEIVILTVRHGAVPKNIALFNGISPRELNDAIVVSAHLSDARVFPPSDSLNLSLCPALPCPALPCAVVCSTDVTGAVVIWSERIGGGPANPPRRLCRV
jgi:hypothetical protein